MCIHVYVYVSTPAAGPGSDLSRVHAEAAVRYAELRFCRAGPPKP